jgi:hypothetical protein
MAANGTAGEDEEFQWRAVWLECIRHCSLNQLRSAFEKKWKQHFASKASKEVFNSWMFEELASKSRGKEGRYRKGHAHCV